MNQFLDEGYIKFVCNWINKPSPIPVPDSLLFWRDKMHQLGLIGYYPQHKVGYGNISIRTKQGILISGTQTGNSYPIKATDFTLVTAYDIDKNNVTCKGQIKASSETMTHAAIYEADKSINAVIHIHHLALWRKLLHKVPHTTKNIPYGTPEMANNIKRLVIHDSSLKTEKTIVMEGHVEGIIAFGKNLEEAGNNLLHWFVQ